MSDKQCSSCGGFCGKVCERENVVEPYNGWILRNVYFENGEPLMHSEPESTQSQELFGKTEQLEAEIKRLQELLEKQNEKPNQMPQVR